MLQETDTSSIKNEVVESPLENALLRHFGEYYPRQDEVKCREDYREGSD